MNDDGCGGGGAGGGSSSSGMARAILSSSLTNSSQFVCPPLPGILPGEHRLDRSDNADLKRDINVNSLIMYNYDTEYDDCTALTARLNNNNNSKHNSSTINHRKGKETTANYSAHASNSLANANSSQAMQNNPNFSSGSEHQMHNEMSKSGHFKAESSGFGLKNSKLAEVLKAVEGDIIFGNNSQLSSNDEHCRSKHTTTVAKKSSVKAVVEKNSSKLRQRNKSSHNAEMDDASEVPPVSVTKISTKIFGNRGWFKASKKKKDMNKNEKFNYLAPFRKMLQTKEKSSDDDSKKLKRSCDATAAKTAKKSSSSKKILSTAVEEAEEVSSSRHRHSSRHHRVHRRDSETSHRHRHHHHHHGSSQHRRHRHSEEKTTSIQGEF
jgi:hypothetical protein